MLSNAPKYFCILLEGTEEEKVKLGIALSDQPSHAIRLLPFTVISLVKIRDMIFKFFHIASHFPLYIIFTRF